MRISIILSLSFLITLVSCKVYDSIDSSVTTIQMDDITKNKRIQKKLDEEELNWYTLKITPPTSPTGCTETIERSGDPSDIDEINLKAQSKVKKCVYTLYISYGIKQDNGEYTKYFEGTTEIGKGQNFYSSGGMSKIRVDLTSPNGDIISDIDIGIVETTMSVDLTPSPL